MIDSKSIHTPVFAGPNSIAGLDTRRQDRTNGSSISGLVTWLKTLRLPKVAVTKNYAFAAEGATDSELVSMPALTTDRLLEAAKVKAYVHVGLGMK